MEMLLRINQNVKNFSLAVNTPWMGCVSIAGDRTYIPVEQFEGFHLQACFWDRKKSKETREPQENPCRHI